MSVSIRIATSMDTMHKSHKIDRNILFIPHSVLWKRGMCI